MNVKDMHSAIPEEKLTEAYRLLLDAELSGKVS